MVKIHTDGPQAWPWHKIASLKDISSAISEDSKDQDIQDRFETQGIFKSANYIAGAKQITNTAEKSVSQIIFELGRHLENKLIEAGWRYFTFSNLVDNCYQLFSRNIPSLKNDPSFKLVIEYLVEEYIDNKKIGVITNDELPRITNIAENILDEQVIYFVEALVAEKKVILTSREKEYLKSRGANLDFNEILKQAKEFIIQDKESYKINVPLNKEGTYSLPVIKCLILFEEEDEFVERLSGDKLLQEFLVKYRDHIGRTALHYTVAKDKSKILKALCDIDKIKELINKDDGYGRTALHVASAEGYTNLIDQLLEAGAKLDSTDGYGRTALHIAAISGQVETIEKLIEREEQDNQSSLEKPDNYDRRPLHLAALFNQGEAVEKLLELEADISALDGYGRTPLELAIKNDAAEAVEGFWNAGNDFTKTITKKEDNAIHLAAKYNSVNTLEFLYLCQQYDFNQGNKDGNTPLHNAAYAGSVEAATALLGYGVNTLRNIKDQRTPLEAAMTQHIFLKEEASPRKIQVAAKLIDYDYSEFLNEGGNNFCGTNGIALPGSFINQSSTNHTLKDYYNKAQRGSYFDAAVGKFIYRVCEFLSSKDNNAILPRDKEDHIALITKIAKSGNVGLLQNFTAQLPEFTNTLDEEQQKALFHVVRDNKSLLDLLEPIYNFENKKVTWEQSPKFVINAIKDDLDHFKEAAENPGKLTEFMKKFIEETREKYEAHSLEVPMSPRYNISTPKDIYTLLLRGAISFKREDIVSKILSKNHGNILTHPDATSYSPLSSTLYSGNQNILDEVKNYIELHIRDDNLNKTECEEDDKANILTIMRYPQFEGFTRENYQEILEPLYIDISPFTDLLDSFEDY
jgi:ankyrin repeat protein